MPSGDGSGSGVPDAPSSMIQDAGGVATALSASADLGSYPADAAPSQAAPSGAQTSPPCSRADLGSADDMPRGSVGADRNAGNPTSPGRNPGGACVRVRAGSSVTALAESTVSETVIPSPDRVGTATVRWSPDSLDLEFQLEEASLRSISVSSARQGGRSTASIQFTQRDASPSRAWPDGRSAASSAERVSVASSSSGSRDSSPRSRRSPTVVAKYGAAPSSPLAAPSAVRAALASSASSSSSSVAAASSASAAAATMKHLPTTKPSLSSSTSVLSGLSGPKRDALGRNGRSLARSTPGYLHGRKDSRTSPAVAAASTTSSASASSSSPLRSRPYASTSAPMSLLSPVIGSNCNGSSGSGANSRGAARAPSVVEWTSESWQRLAAITRRQQQRVYEMRTATSPRKPNALVQGTPTTMRTSVPASPDQGVSQELRRAFAQSLSAGEMSRRRHQAVIVTAAAAALHQGHRPSAPEPDHRLFGSPNAHIVCATPPEAVRVPSVHGQATNFAATPDRSRDSSVVSTPRSAFSPRSGVSSQASPREV